MYCSFIPVNFIYLVSKRINIIKRLTMKKNLLFLSLSLFLFSCSNDNGDNNLKKDIVGYWKFEYVSTVDVVTDNEEDTQSVKAFMRAYKRNVNYEFKEDGTGIEYEGRYATKLKYDINGEILTIAFMDNHGEYYEDKTIKKIQINGNTLSFIEDWIQDYYIGFEFPNMKITKAIASVNFIRR